MMRRFARTACWILAALVPILGASVLLLVTLQSDTSDPLFWEGFAYFVVAVGGTTLILTFALAGAALVLGPARGISAVVYLTLLGLTSLYTGAVITPNLGADAASWPFWLLVIASGAFYLLWRDVEAVWHRRIALGAAVLSFGLAARALLPFPIDAFVLIIIAGVLITIERLDKSINHLHR